MLSKFFPALCIGMELHPDSEFTHIAVNTNTQKGIVEWLEKVTDEEYNGFK